MNEERKITDLEKIHEEACHSTQSVNVDIAVSCLHRCAEHLEQDLKKESFKKSMAVFSPEDISVIIANRFILEFSVNIMLNSIKDPEEAEKFKNRARAAYEEFSQTKIEKVD